MDPLTGSRLPLVDLANRALGGAWARGLLTEPPLESKSLISKAERRERMAIDAGDWSEALDRLTADLERFAALNPLGRAMAHGQLVDILRQRIRAGKLWRRRPEILDQGIDRPVVILGHMRSGTTLMHRLLACDPAFAFTRLHESLWPLALTTDGAKARATALSAGLGLLNPALRSAHPTAARAAEEEFGLHAFSLHGAMIEAQWNVPGFAKWSQSRPLEPVYDEFQSLVQTLRWRRGDNRKAIQLLKAPQFMQDLDALIATYPDARIIMLVRDPAAVVASSASLVWNQRRIQSDSTDRVAIGREWLAKTRMRQERAQRALAKLPSSRVLLVDFDSLTTAWDREIKRTYEFLELPLIPSAQAKMRRLTRSSRHRGHHYSPAQFGLHE